MPRLNLIHSEATFVEAHRGCGDEYDGENAIFRMREQKYHQYLGRYGAYSGAEARRCERDHSYGSIARAKIALDTKGRNLQMAQMAWASHS